MLKRCFLVAAAAVLFVLMTFPKTASAVRWWGCDGCGVCDCGSDYGVMKPLCRAQSYNWNRNYAYYQYGRPLALVVPPTANLQTNWGWGVSSSRVSRIDHQFGRNYPGQGPFSGPSKHTPRWPQDTNQFGVYYVRGPW
jgi:hypothetical protein